MVMHALCGVWRTWGKELVLVGIGALVVSSAVAFWLLVL